MNKHLLTKEGLRTVTAQFPESKRGYTYWTTNAEISVSNTCLVKAPKGWTHVLITAVHDEPQIDLKAKFEYKELEHLVHFKQDGGVVVATCDSLATHAAGVGLTTALANLTKAVQNSYNESIYK